MTILVPTRDPTERLWFEDFAAFCAALGRKAEAGRRIELALPDGAPLILGWACET